MIYETVSRDPREKRAQKSAGKLTSPQNIDHSILQTLKYEYPKRKIMVELASDEFTCVCPFSGLPDFAKLIIRYTPRRKLIEMKSLKYYLYAFRGVKIYNEHAVNKIFADLTRAINPRQLTVIGQFTSRGGITNTVTAARTRG